jgi:hypothetical protein
MVLHHANLWRRYLRYCIVTVAHRAHPLVRRLYDTLPDSEEYVAKLQAEIYRVSSPGDLHTPEIDPHRMALLFTIHGLGSLLDLDKEPYSPDAWTCLDLAKACLAVRPVLDFPSISSIQAMVRPHSPTRLRSNPEVA